MSTDMMLGRLVMLAAVALLASCGSNEMRDRAPSGSVSIPDLPGDAIPKPEPRSRYGNPPVYEVFGKKYTVMDSSHGYSERGVASWYGKKFHGRLTSNREPYDMYAMTAAHKSLPLPTYVRVRNLRNNKAIVVRVNDRGPFVHNRVIDLSYAAALKLDMVQDGTSLVEVTAISFDEPAGDRPTRQTSLASPKPVPVPRQPPVPAATPAGNQGGAVAAVPVQKIAEEPKIYVQVGAFGSRENAERQSAALRAAHIGNVFIHTDVAAEAELYRVRIGPVTDVEQYDVIVSELESIGIPKPLLITE